MNGYTVLFLVVALIVLGVSRIARQVVFHPLQTGIHAVKDLIAYIRHKGWNTCPVGALDIYCGYFGSGKTLSLVHKVVGLYNRYNDKPVWCSRRKKFVTQKINVLSNVDLATVYKGNIIKNLIMDCQSYTKYRPNETTGGIFVSWRRKEELPTGA